MQRKQKKYAFILEDDLDNLQVLSDLLTFQEFTVVTASSVREARKKLSEVAELNLFVFDLILGDGLGTELLTLVREKFPDVFIIMVTAVPTQENRALADSHHVEHILVKPFNANEFGMLLNTVLQNPE